ncbi:hypothetical protein PR002_g15056 [Phytophthora rubi]|uniref:Uncharacterized protein n=1 Tax=Phytophthora rubi TaxID=129364 RepID=A0A6A3L0T1_9STRA|nr:hypothetical protein PR002_g15056 [Phytophthora rubi]
MTETIISSRRPADNAGGERSECHQTWMGGVDVHASSQSTTRQLRLVQTATRSFAEARQQYRRRTLGVQLIGMTVCRHAFLTWSGHTKARAVTNHV